GGWCIFVGLSAYKGPSYLLLFQSSDFYTKRFWFWVGERRMEGNKQKGTSCSFTSELFGSKESHLSSSSSGIFGSIFSPSSSKVLGRESLRNELNGKIANESWTSKIGIQDNFSKGNDSKTKDAVNKDMSSIYQHQRVQPCHLSSSIYYGGQDIYFNPQSPQNEGYFSSLHKNDGEDDSEIASRGDWWQGMISLLLRSLLPRHVLPKVHSRIV
ncbi:hypothetical protein CR513_24398, partial [Mucuna pruriens]